MRLSCCITCSGIGRRLVLKPVFPRLNGRTGTACDDSSTILATAINPRSRNAIPARAESRMDKNDISSNVLDKLTAQKYGPDASLDGRKIDFSFHVDDGGDFHEVVRRSRGFANTLPDFELRQLNCSRFNPGLVKGFHPHLMQDEMWAVHPMDRLLVGLIYVRKSSRTEGECMRFVLGGGNSGATSKSASKKMLLARRASKNRHRHPFCGRQTVR